MRNVRANCARIVNTRRIKSVDNCIATEPHPIFSPLMLQLATLSHMELYSFYPFFLFKVLAFLKHKKCEDGLRKNCERKPGLNKKDDWLRRLLIYCKNYEKEPEFSLALTSIVILIYYLLTYILAFSVSFSFCMNFFQSI